MTIKNYDQAVALLKSKENFDFEETYALVSCCNKLSYSDEENGRDLVIRLLDKSAFLDKDCTQMVNDLVDVYGLYPYLDESKLTGSAQLRYELHKSSYLKEIYLHHEQFEISNEIHNNKSVVVSAPTSFGKSLLIEELVASQKFDDIVIIQPTLALLDETRKKLSKYNHHYKIIVSTGQLPMEGRGNIFLFTGERVVEYAHFKKIDFFIIDEFYKLSLKREDDRAITLNSALHKLLKYTSKFYMLGPMIKQIPTEFKKKFDIVWYPSEFRTVAVEEISLELKEKLKQKEKEERKQEELFDLLKGVSEPTLIYCSSPNKATKLAIGFVEYLKENGTIGSSAELNAKEIEWLEENLHHQWFLIEGLKKYVAIHHGAVPRHLGSSIVDLFNNGSIMYLFCTSTLIEGVNTSAKNVILFDKKKGTKDIDFFDYKNIAGRSGRMKNYYIGNVYRFEAKPSQLELDVDIPIFSQDDAPEEILINLDENELKKSSKDRLKKFEHLDDEFRGILKRNSSISLDGQVAIMEIIKNNPRGFHELLSWDSYPTYVQLEAVIKFCWENLLKKGENKADIRSAGHLAVMTMKYANFKSVKGLINELISENYWIEKYPVEQDRINYLAYFTLNVSRHWFDYKLPKWLSLMSDIQSYVFSEVGLKPGNYTFYASLIENGFLRKNLAALIEYDVPHSAIVKIEKALQNKEIETEELIANLISVDEDALKRIGLLAYEINKIKSIYG